MPPRRQWTSESEATTRGLPPNSSRSCSLFPERFPFLSPPFPPRASPCRRRKPPRGHSHHRYRRHNLHPPPRHPKRLNTHNFCLTKRPSHIYLAFTALPLPLPRPRLWCRRSTSLYYFFFGDPGLSLSCQSVIVTSQTLRR